ncbi:MAG: PQQ-binding-like beta-propeller repeat protein, partial [Candidatus Sumerlaeaceae bacterium]|nr:PQQ-binding-like beta-propeller repeat protein [Candidatus Sumerlaeaceae bacterium]
MGRLNLCLLCVWVVVLGWCGPGLSHAQLSQPFWFVHMSDTHIGVAGADERLSATLLDIKRHFPETAFVINTGDLTEMGSGDELTTYVQLIRTWPFPVYNTVGNHDVRWSESGKGKFRELVGPTRLHFEHNGIHFFLLDTSVLAEHHGHFNSDDLEWLDNELGKLPAGTPAVIGVHHPPMMPASTTDNDTEFAEVIARHNVPLVLVGHGHTFHRYTLNGSTYTMGASTSYVVRLGQPCYRAFYVDSKGFRPYLRIVPRDSTTSESLIPLEKPVDPYGELRVDSIKEVSRTSLQLDCRLTSTGRAKLTTGTYELDKAYRGVFSFSREGRFKVSAPLLPEGTHRLTVTFVDDRKSTHARSTLFTSKRQHKDANLPVLLRQFSMPSTIQSSPVVYKNIMFIGCNDGTFRAYDLVSAEVLWEHRLGAEIISVPAASNGVVVVGCNDGYVRCFDAYTGEVRWSQPTGAAVLASPRVVGESVYVGSGDGRMYAFDLDSGKKLWDFSAQKMIKCRPAYANGRLFFGAWDNWFYSVDARQGKMIWKVPVSVTSQFSAATANPATTGTRVIFTSHDYCVRCLDQKTGSHLWMYRPLPNELGPSYSSFVFYQNDAYSGSIAGTVVGFNLLTGRKVADIPMRASVADELFDSAPVLDGDYLYVGSTGGNVYCVDLRAKKVCWAYALQPGFIFSSPSLWGDRLLVAS